MRKFVVLIVIVLIVVGGWTGGWFWAAGEVRSRIAALGTADSETSARVTCGSLDVTGFPFRLDIACTEATVVDGDVTATVAGLRASMLVYNPTQLVFSALAPVGLADAYSGARSRIDFSGAEGSVRLVTDDALRGLTGAGWRLGRASVVADDLVVTDTLVGETLAFSAGHAEAHLLDIPQLHDAERGTAALAAYASLADAAAPGLAVAAGEASLEAELSGLPNDVRRLADADLVCALRDSGGELKLVAARGAAGEEFLEGSGAVTLGADGKPEGQLNLTSRGVVERIEPLLPPELRFVFGPQAADGSYAQTLNFRAGVVLAGLLPLPFLLPPLCAG